ncbi:hypothetical protein AUTU_42980 (plasmid) [Aureibacter tunicatorum]|nr:hypothetical protein AUTU_42980 [Aureibacter tunicatorum]
MEMLFFDIGQKILIKLLLALLIQNRKFITRWMREECWIVSNVSANENQIIRYCFFLNWLRQ